MSFITTEELEALMNPRAKLQAKPHDVSKESPSSFSYVSQPPVTDQPASARKSQSVAATGTATQTGVSSPSLEHAVEPSPVSMIDQKIEVGPPPALPRILHDTVVAKQVPASKPTEIRPSSVFQQRQREAARMDHPTSTAPPTPTADKLPATAGIETGVEAVDLPKPEYPRRSRRLGEEGLVLLEVEVLPDGRAGRIRVLNDAGYPRLVQAAIAAVREAHFTPATRNGRSVSTWVQIPFEFTLNKE